MGALTGLWNSEKGLLGLTLIIAATVLVALGHMSIDQWSIFTGAIYGAYAVTKTVQGAIATKYSGGEPDERSEARLDKLVEAIGGYVAKRQEVDPVPPPIATKPTIVPPPEAA